MIKIVKIWFLIFWEFRKLEKFIKFKLIVLRSNLIDISILIVLWLVIKL